MVKTAGAGSCRGRERKALRVRPSGEPMVMRLDASASATAQRTPLERARTAESPDKAARREIGTMAHSHAKMWDRIVIWSYAWLRDRVRLWQSLSVNLGRGAHNGCGKTHNSPQIARRCLRRHAEATTDPPEADQWIAENLVLTGDDARTLRWVDGFRELPPDAIRSISGKCRWRWYKAQRIIFSRGEPTNDVFFLVQGKVRITSYSAMGKEVSFRDLTVGQSFGDVAAIDGRSRSATAVAMSDTLLASISAQTYWEIMMNYPPVAAACLRRLANLVRALSDRVVEYSLLPVPTRIKLELLRLAQSRIDKTNGAKIDPAPTHAEI